MREFDGLAMLIEGSVLFDPVPKWITEQYQLTREDRDLFFDADSYVLSGGSKVQFLQHAHRLGLAPSGYSLGD